MILIADSGSTKALWIVLHENKVLHSISTQGINPYTMSAQQIESVFTAELIPHLNPKSITNVFYYGAGCSEVDKCLMLQIPLQNNFPQAKVEVNHDLLAAARALCGTSPGIACILGTGSNSCSFDGKNIIKNVKALGYILGDEGSGAYMGKKLLTDYLNDDLRIDLKNNLEKTFQLSPANVLDKVYKQSNPNRYMASFAQYIFEHKEEKYFKELIENALQDFFHQHLSKYPQVKDFPIHFVGSIAFHFQEFILNLLQKSNWKSGSILKDPMQGLIQYHSQS